MIQSPQTVILIGTNRTIASLARQLRAISPSLRVVGCLTLDPTPEPMIARVPVWGSAADLALAYSAARFDIAVVCLPASLEARALNIRARLREMGIAERVVAPLEDSLAQSPSVRTNASPQSLDITELIGRVPYGIDRRTVGRILEGKRILITGAGGSIGSELARIAATFRPELLILMERSENALFEIDRRIASRFPDVARKALLHDVTDAAHTLSHLKELKPHTVFHAAAHKHVPLMEDHPAHAITNNLFGTKSIADASLACGAERFVLISSDKAVNPTSVMGATKRLAEMYVQSLSSGTTTLRVVSEASATRVHTHHAERGGTQICESRTRFSMVRFGNVLGSACSVLPIWAAQLAEGGPITVTDERMTRYFMTIHEAATLVIQAAAIEPKEPGSAAVYVLDMGEPIRILDLAKRFVRAHGFEIEVAAGRADALPYGRAACSAGTCTIILSGIRPGEKLHEELAYAAESLLPTPHPGIRAWAGGLPASFNHSAMLGDLAAIEPTTDRQTVLAAIRRHVPEMASPQVAGVSNEPNLEPKPIRDHALSQLYPTVKAA